jgi:hypothetical protein
VERAEDSAGRILIIKDLQLAIAIMVSVVVPDSVLFYQSADQSKAKYRNHRRDVSHLPAFNPASIAVSVIPKKSTC